MGYELLRASTAFAAKMSRGYFDTGHSPADNEGDKIKEEGGTKYPSKEISCG
jgi:hypothetical protein